MAKGKRYDIDALLDEVITLPSMPDTLGRITKLVNDPNCSLGDVAKAVSSDPAIALKTLRLVNSAYYGLGQQVATVEHAVVLLGLKVIKNLALTATVFATIRGSAELFLRHCIGCGVAMKVLAENGPLSGHLAFADEAFVYGLLHDIGKVILEEYLPSEYDQVRRAVQERAIPWHEAEEEVIGADHAALGARLAEKWKLAAPMSNAIAGHHNLEQCSPDYRILAAHLTIADYLCAASGLPAYENPVFALQDDVWAVSQISPQVLAKIIERYFDSFSVVNEFVEVAS